MGGMKKSEIQTEGGRGGGRKERDLAKARFAHAAATADNPVYACVLCCVCVDVCSVCMCRVCALCVCVSTRVLTRVHV